MKKLFLVLLAVNALVFLWWQSDTSDEKVLNTPSSIDASRSLVLLSEADEVRKQDDLNQKSSEDDEVIPDTAVSEVKEVVISDAKPVIADQRSCYTVGPFVSQNRAKEVTAELIRLGVEVNQRTTHTTLHAGYRVYISPLPSAAAERDMLQELKRKGIKDSAVIRHGEYKNSISLGVFSMQGGAKRHQKAMSKKGLNVKMAERYRDSEQYWFDVYDVGQTDSSSPVWIALSEKYPEIKKQAINCK